MYHLSAIIGFLLALPSFYNSVVTSQSLKPNLVMIVSDDMGFNDIGFHGSDQIPTPNIDAIAAYGINLNRYYVSPMCTPTRSALMTGKYSSTVGMQHYVIVANQPYGLGLDEKILPQYLKDVGYKTHIVGKWHLGYYKKAYTPTFRGFDSHVGYYNGLIDYYSHTLNSNTFNYTGYDMRNNLNPFYETRGTYATDLFTEESIKIIRNHNKESPLFLYIPHLTPHAANANDPLQAPQATIDKFSYIKDLKRRKYAAMVSTLDDSVGKVVTALKDNQMLDNTVILFFCDNGAPIEGMEHSNGGSNNPFKGQKQSPWEGAVRSAGAIWSPLLQSRERTSNQLFHITDWLPTFAALAGVRIPTPIDGKNIWPALTYNLNSPRTDVLLHLDDVAGYHAYINGDFKLVNGTTYNGSYDRWMDNVDKTEVHPMFQTYGESIRNSLVGQAFARYSLTNLSALAIEVNRQNAIVTCNNVRIPTERQFQCFPLESPCLFNITFDPCERRNIAALNPGAVDVLENKIDLLRQTDLPMRNQPSDERCNPANFNNTWTWWYDELGIPDHDEIVAFVTSCKCTHCNNLAVTILIVVMLSIFNAYV